MINVEKVKPTGIFTNYIYKAIPLAFDESMSYYECLCGLLNYLKNTVMPALNNNADALIELQNYCEELKNYVDHYFDNLDVQEEINNKLDEMAEQGQLTDIIAQYLGLAGLLIFDTLEDLKDAENVTNGSSVMTLGYYAIGDGGSAKYKIRQVINTDTPNDENIIALQDENLVAEIIIDNNTLNVKQFGAKGDGLTDDSSIIQDVIDYCSANNYKVYIDSDTYLIETGLLINNNNSLLECDGTLKINSNITCITINGFNQRIKINKLLSDDRTGIGFKSNAKLGYSDIEIAFIDDFDKGISLDTSTGSTDGILYNYIKNNTIIANTGIYLNANTQYINNNFFYLGYIGGGTAISSVAITGIGEYNGNIFNNIGFENLTKCLDLNNFEDNTFKDFRIYESITGSKFISLTNCKNNLFKSNTTSAILQNNKIEDNTTRANANVFDCRITQYANVNSEYGRKMLSYNNKFEIIENGNMDYKEWNFANGDYNVSALGSLHAVTQFCTYNSEANTSITLDDLYAYDNYYTRNLTLFIGYVGATTTLKMYDKDNNTIFDLDDFMSDLTPGKTATFKFELVNGTLIPYLIHKTS